MGAGCRLIDLLSTSRYKLLMKVTTLALVAVLLVVSQAIIPEAMVGLSVDVVNKLLGDSLGPLITDKIKDTDIKLTLN